MMNAEPKFHVSPVQQHRALMALERRRATFVGEEQQSDTYFNVPCGRLKLRETIAGGLLMHFIREASMWSLASVTQLSVNDAERIGKVLAASIGVLATVHKKRATYRFLDIDVNLDHVNGLGYFVEIQSFAHDRCELVMGAIGLSRAFLAGGSYCDLMLKSLSSMALLASQPIE